MKVRAVDSNHDWTFGRGLQDYVINDRAVSQNVKTRILSFYGDCFFDELAGIDWFNLLGYGAQELLLMSVKQTVINTEGVTAINNVDVHIDIEKREFLIRYDIQTIYSRSYIEEFNLMNLTE